MEFEVLNNEQQAFKPIELKITFNSKQDLIDMWCRYNLDPRVVNDSQRSGESRVCINEDWELWRFLDDQLEKLENA